MTKTKLIAYGKAALDFAGSHKAEIATAISYAASLPLPGALHQVAVLAAVASAALAGMKYAPKAA
jgi:hypothetical protein